MNLTNQKEIRELEEFANRLDAYTPAICTENPHLYLVADKNDNPEIKKEDRLSQWFNIVVPKLELSSLIKVNEGKRPMEKGWEIWCEKPRDLIQLRKELDNNTKMLGIPCGPVNNLFVVDVDDDQRFNQWLKDNHLEEEWQAQTDNLLKVKTGKGFHFYFNYPAGRFPESDVAENTNRADKIGFDIRGLGGQVIAPYSIHPTGKIYTLIAGEKRDISDKMLNAIYQPKVERKKIEHKPSTHTAEEIREKLLRNPETKAIYDGDVSKFNGDYSSADMSLVSRLAFYTQDIEQIDQIWFNSPLADRSQYFSWQHNKNKPKSAKNKVKERDDYRRDTINKALRKLTETYDWNKSATTPLDGGYYQASENEMSVDDFVKTKINNDYIIWCKEGGLAKYGAIGNDKLHETLEEKEYAVMEKLVFIYQLKNIDFCIDVLKKILNEKSNIHIDESYYRMVLDALIIRFEHPFINYSSKGKSINEMDFKEHFLTHKLPEFMKNICCEERDKLLFFNGKFWEVCGEEVMENYIRRVYPKLICIKGCHWRELINEMMVKTRDRINPFYKDTPPYFKKKETHPIPFQNGTLYFNNGDFNFKQGYWDSEDYARFIILANFEQWMVDTDKWEETIIGEYFHKTYTEAWEPLQMFLGSILTPSIKIEKMIFIYGERDLGKSTLSKTIQSLFPEYLISSSNMGGWEERFALAPLKNSLLNFSDEISGEFLQKNSSIFKTLVSCEPMSLELKYKDRETWLPKAKHIAIGNELPKIKPEPAVLKRLSFVKGVIDDTLSKYRLVFQEIFYNNRLNLLNFMLRGIKKLYNNNWEYDYTDNKLSDTIIDNKYSIYYDFLSEYKIVIDTELDLLGRPLHYLFSEQLHKDFLDYYENREARDKNGPFPTLRKNANISMMTFILNLKEAMKYKITERELHNHLGAEGKKINNKRTICFLRCEE